jgi:eukaryotic-like serine/threonine-protein kinase
MPDLVQTQSRLGKYRLLGELGRGGMARVFLALTSGPAGFNKLAVIKEIHDQLADDPEFVTMFLDEARLAARLNHPNVVQTNEVGQEGNRYYIAMEYLEGQTFRRVLNRVGRGSDAALTLGMKLRVLSEALAGLHHAHELTDYNGAPLGVVHRDFSPHNIFVTYNGQVKVVDFGIAKALDSQAETRTGVLKGKVQYMSPEQARGEAVDRTADIFSCGVLLWELCTGHRLFRGLNDVVILQKLLTYDLPRPSEAKPDIHSSLERIIVRAMAPTRDGRQQTAHELQEELEQFLQASGEESSIRDVGRLVGEQFAEERERIRQLVEQQIRQTEQGISISQLPMIEAPPTSHPQSTLPSGESETPASHTHGSGLTGTTHVLTGTQTRIRRRRSMLLMVFGGVAVATAAGAVVIVARSDDTPTGAATAEPTATAKSHRLRIDSRPSGARVRCGDADVGTTPMEVEMSDGQTPCRYRLSLDGFDPYDVEQGPLHDNVTVVGNLVAAKAPTPAALTASAEPSTRPRVGGGRPPPPPGGGPPPPPPPLDIKITR